MYFHTSMDHWLGDESLLFPHFILLFLPLSAGTMRPWSQSDRSRRVAPNTFTDLQSAGRNLSAATHSRVGQNLKRRGGLAQTGSQQLLCFGWLWDMVRGRSHSCSCSFVYVAMSDCTTCPCLQNFPDTWGVTQMALITCRADKCRPRQPVPVFPP